MGRFRSFVRQAVRPAAMVGAVGVLSLSLVITTPSTAQALVPKIPVTPTFVMGAVKTVAPVAMAVVSVTPLGWGLRLMQLGMLAFSTSDMWMPYVTGTFGQPDPDKPAESSYQILPTFRLGTLTLTNPRQLALTWTYAGTHSSNQTGYVSYAFNCRQTANDSSQHAVGSIFINSANTGISTTLNSSTKSGTINANFCPVGSEIVDGVVGGQTNAPGPENTLTYGNVGGFDPRGNDVTYQGNSECIDSLGNINWTSGPIVPGDNGALLMPSCEKAGFGHGTGRSTVEAFKPDGTKTTVWDTGAQPLSDPATPLCDPGRAGSGCVLEVLKDDAPCKSGDVECENWSEEHSKDPTRWKCKLGPYTMPLSVCNLLEQAYRPGGAPVNDPNTDGDPATRSNLGPDGQPAPGPAPAPVTGPGTGTGPAPAPGGSGQTTPSADSGARQCFPTGWAAFNPVEWVLKPLRCAFEPTKDVSSIGQIFRDKAKMKSPSNWIVAATLIEAPSGSNCPNWTINVQGLSKNVVCESSFTAALLGVRLPLFGLVATAMVWPLIRAIWYAAIPVLRVTPGGK